MIDLEWYGYVIIIVVFILLFWMYIGLYVAMEIVTPSVKTLNQTEVEEASRDESLLLYLRENLTNQYQIKSIYGYMLQVYEMVKDPENNKFVVIAHGYTYSHHGAIKYGKMMMDLGYNVILYDHRFHGLSGGKNTTLGYYEKDDLKTVIDHVYQTYGDVFLGTYGESMGSATVLLEQQNDPRVRFVVSDAGFKDLSSLIRYRLKVKGLFPLLVFPMTKLFIYFISKAKFNQVSPIEALKNQTIPMMFVHGEQDDFIGYQDSIDMFESYQGPKHLYIAKKEAYHARSYYANKEEYFNELSQFLSQYELI